MCCQIVYESWHLHTIGTRPGFVNTQSPLQTKSRGELPENPLVKEFVYPVFPTDKFYTIM